MTKVEDLKEEYSKELSKGNLESTELTTEQIGALNLLSLGYCGKGATKYPCGVKNVRETIREKANNKGKNSFLRDYQR